MARPSGPSPRSPDPVRVQRHPALRAPRPIFVCRLLGQLTNRSRRLPAGQLSDRHAEAHRHLLLPARAQQIRQQRQPPAPRRSLPEGTCRVATARAWRSGPPRATRQPRLCVAWQAPGACHAEPCVALPAAANAHILDPRRSSFRPCMGGQGPPRSSAGGPRTTIRWHARRRLNPPTTKSEAPSDLPPLGRPPTDDDHVLPARRRPDLRDADDLPTSRRINPAAGPRR